MICTLLFKIISFFFRSLAVGTRCGYKLFSLSSTERLDEIHEYGIHVCYYYEFDYSTL